MIFEKAEILLPKIEDYRKWAVIACDQFTSQPEYWNDVRDMVNDAISSIHLILPEAQLSKNNDSEIHDIHNTMDKYLENDIFNVYENSYIYAFYGAQRSPFCFRTAAFRSQRPPIF